MIYTFTCNETSNYFTDVPMVNEERNYTAEFAETDITLVCDICAYPEPSYQWFHEETLIGEATRRTHTIGTVSNISFGYYRCEVNNAIGSTNFSTHLLESSK